jgi:crossover junction endodeoxyribonuclease RusA
MLILELPLPNSMNSHWRHAKGRTYISAQGIAFRTAVGAIASRYGAVAPKGRLSIGLEIFPRDRRVMDIDNRIKSLFDALQHAKVFEDDSLIDEIKVVRRNIVKGGMCRVFISEYIDRSADMTLELTHGLKEPS